MEQVIYKYELNVGETAVKTSLAIAKILHVGLDGNNNICVWILHYVDLPKANTLWFSTYMTGQTIHEDIMNKLYLGTIIHPNGFVTHTFGA